MNGIPQVAVFVRRFISVDTSRSGLECHLTDHAMPFSYRVRQTSALGGREEDPGSFTLPWPYHFCYNFVTCGVALPEMLIQQTR
jgi:hypothetical protein